ncbi:FecR domain-containing protein [Trichlorobacter ammonificans]|uniref:Peptidoglycan binding protein n=1 Tax=Trichlorobacter ammonificans TaxID=2916410 RepID=A0ABN8HF11_9BACT|nr:FecR domain-containing protein [Trichlorobacter ammonificans]CAH2029838.1 putative peptidoglycan binding protein [Trichlorobacter ammonificans]
MKAAVQCIAGLLLLPALTGGLAGRAEAQTGRMAELRVVSRDSLSGICAKYLQQPEKWRQVARLNRLGNPDLIRPGQTLRLPVEMLKGVAADGTVELLRGRVLVRAPRQGNWRTLTLHDRIVAGSALKTEADSDVEVRFADGTTFTMRENSELTVAQSVEGPLHLLRSLRLSAGKVISRIQSATGRASRYEVETPSVLAAVRGTSYRVALDEALTTRVESLEHAIDVSSQGASLLLPEGTGTVVPVNARPLPPVTLPTPPEPEALAPVYGDRVSTIRFAPVAGAAGYRVLLAEDAEGKRALRTATIAAGEPFTFEGVADGSYFLLATTIDRSGLEGPSSPSRRLTVRRKPLPPSIVQPVPDATVPEMPLKVQWHHVVGATSYQVQVASTPDFSTDVVFAGDNRQTVQIMKELAAGSYWLRARSLAEDGYAGDWSEARAFSMVKSPAPALHKPTADDDNLYLEWEALPGAAAYHLQIARDDSFRNPIVQKTVQETKLVLADDLQPGRYAVRVSGLAAGGAAGGFSTTGVFDVEKKPHYYIETLGAVGGLLLLLLLL